MRLFTCLCLSFLLTAGSMNTASCDDTTDLDFYGFVGIGLSSLISPSIKLNTDASSVFGDATHSLVDAVSLQITNINGDNPIDTNIASLMSNGNSDKYRYKYGFSGSAGIGVSIENFRVELEGLYLINEPEKDENGKIYNKIHLKGVAINSSNYSYKLYSTESNSGEAVPSAENEGFNMKSVMGNLQVGVPLSSYLSLYSGVGIGLSKIEFLETELVTWSAQAKVSLEMDLGDDVSLDVTARYLRALSDEFDDASFATDIDDLDIASQSGGGSSQFISGKISVPTNIRHQYSTLSAEAGIKFVF